MRVISVKFSFDIVIIGLGIWCSRGVFFWIRLRLVIIDLDSVVVREVSSFDWDSVEEQEDKSS